MTDDGVALTSATHPVGMTDAMVEAGVRVAWTSGDLQGNAIAEDLVKAIYTAMASAAPPLGEFNEESMTRALVEIRLHDDMVERFAIRCALFKAGEAEQWPETTSEEDKTYWRLFVRELAAEIYDAPRQMRLITDEDHAPKE